MSTLSPVVAARPRTPALSASSPLALRVETVDTNEGLAALRGEWNELLSASGSNHVFLTWDWLEAWAAHLSFSSRLAVLTVRRGAALLGIAPLLSRGASVLGATRLSFLGAGRAGSDYLDVIAREGFADVVVSRLAAHLLETGAQLEMSEVRIPGSVGSRLARALRERGCPVRAQRTHRCPFIDLRAHTFDTYLRTLGSEHRYGFHRKLRRLETRHEMRFEQVSTESRRAALLPVLFELHRKRWSDRGGSDGLEGRGIFAFHDEVTRRSLERGWLRLNVLWLGEAPAAAVYGFRHGPVFSFYQSGFDPYFSKLSVGLVATGLTIRNAMAEGVADFDFLHGEEAYKFHWATGARRLGRLTIFPHGPLGRLAAMSAASRDGLRRLARGLPLGLAARVTAFRRGGS